MSTSERRPGADLEFTTYSRRSLLAKMTALGLVAVSGLAEPQAGTAVASQKRDRGGSSRRHRHGKPGNTRGHDQSGAESETVRASTTRRHRGVTAEMTLVDLPDPIIKPPTGKKILSIGALSGQSTRVVQVEGTITFDSEHVALMKNGRQFRLTCEIWGIDTGLSNPVQLEKSDRLFTLLKPKSEYIYSVPTTLAGTTLAPQKFLFSEPVLTSKLNEDVSSIFDLFDDDQDDIMAFLILTTRRNKTKPWTPVLKSFSNQVQGFF